MSHLMAPTPPVAGRFARGAAALVITVAFLAACGGEDDPEVSTTPAGTTTAEMTESPAPAGETEPTAEDGETQTLTATEVDFAIELEEENLSPGMYEITVVNEGNATHDLVVERDGEDVEGTEVIPPGESATLMVELESGDYVFYCSVGNHRAMGMEIDVSVS